MRHRKSGRKLNRSASHRKAMFRNMAKALLTYESIRTTEAKAKELRKIVDRLITMALKNDLHARRQAYKILGSHQMVQRLFDEIGPRFEGGTGGYTRIIKLSSPRKGDAAPMVIIELTKLAGEAKAEEPKAEEAKPAKKAAPKKEAKAEEKAEKPAKKAAPKKAAAKKDEGEEKPAEESAEKSEE
ncbi:50S ribosomal protein L17 [Salidesulfovibrio onnuriiensis]|uniref:50S ribosomal protein L17 n=1 Tax=Salidesulfovibrio onnuriiensis TaxID=2583823 RepID=UPI0011C76C13|nr:50S ribosomal protein L17 [Salidesulfovibrio onnuriiensis]